MSLARRPSGYTYTKLEKEGAEEQIHRRAQFLIYKVMEKADSRRRQTSLRVRICRLKVKIGKRLKRLRRSVMVSVSVVRVDVYKQIMCQLKELKRMLCSRDASIGIPSLVM